MNRVLPALLVLPFLLAGCTGVAIPDDAQKVTHSDAPDATLWAWVEPADNFTRIVAHFEHNGSGLVRVNEIQPHGEWNLTILNENGEPVLYDQRPARKDFDKLVLAPFEETFYFTWLHNEYERYQQAGTYDAIPQHPVEPGTYTAIVAFNLFDAPDDFAARLPIVVA